jgi:hypothetical protein
MSWSHIGRYPDPASIVAEANKRRLRGGCLIFSLHSRAQLYDVWVNDDAAPTDGTWRYFANRDSENVAKILNDYGIPAGEAVLSLDGSRTDYIVLYLSFASGTPRDED